MLQGQRCQWKSVSSYFHARENDHDVNTAGVLTMDEARPLASNFAKLPEPIPIILAYRRQQKR